MAQSVATIQLQKLSVGPPDKRLLHNTSLTVEPGETLVLHGPSGGGKSTLLKTLLGGYPWTDGEYRLEGKTITAQTIDRVRAAIAYIPQQPDLGNDTVLHCLQQPFSWRSFRTKRFCRTTLLDWFQQLALDETLLQQPCSRLSGGQRQRIAIIRALMTGRRILVADEPTSALDPEASQTIRDVLLSGRYTVISASHDANWIQQCSRKLTIKDGTLVDDTAQRATNDSTMVTEHE
ncbi:ATP-binding cassette domain-containing protein [Kistimonas scapharcae]|uniref:ATP-binding cassette domain-containing protein n=1 Tax=Kistimonas scapharcae TaxID=1036133 RepID=A0ABP8V3I2_9GAMM